MMFVAGVAAGAVLVVVGLWWLRPVLDWKEERDGGEEGNGDRGCCG